MSVTASLTARAIARFGSDFTLRRHGKSQPVNAWTQVEGVKTYHPFRGRLRHYRPHEIRGGIQEHDMLLVADPATLAVTPAKGDRIGFGTLTSDTGGFWTEIISVYFVLAKGAVMAYRIQVRQ